MRSRREAGQVIPLIALSLSVLMGFAGLGVDVGYWQYHQREQQSATDAAAIGGAQQLIYAGCGNFTSAQTAAQTDSASNGFTNGSNGVTVAVANPPAAGAYTGNTCAVDVKITSTNTPRFFSRFFANGSSTVTATTEAVATIVNNANGCMYLLQQNQTLQLNGVHINSPNCGVLANSTMVQTNGGTVTVGSFGYAHSLQDNSTDFTKASPQRMQPVADPCAEISGCAYLAANAPPTPTCGTFHSNGSTQTIGPGCYSSFQMNSGTVTMSPGQYIFTGTVQANGGTLIGNGVSMYVTSTGGPVQFNGSSDTFSAPSTGSNAGVLLYQSPANTNVVQFNGGSVSMSGLVYAPNALGQVNGNSGGYLVLVFGSMQFNGSSTYSLGGPVLGSSLIKNAVLAQ